MNALAALLLCYAGCAGLALAQEQHHRQVLQRRPSDRTRWALQGAGALGLIASLVSCIGDFGLSTGLALWTGAFMLASLVLALVITYRAHVMASSLVVAWVAGSIGCIVL